MRPTRLVLAALAVAAALGAGVAIASRALSDPRPSIYGVRLGMTADEIRARIDEAHDGTWSASADSGEWVLEHTQGDTHARFELHDGQLMAIRVDAPLTAALAGAPLEVTEGTVLTRREHDGRIAWTLLSRSCPTHRAEAEALVISGRAFHR